MSACGFQPLYFQPLYVNTGEFFHFQALKSPLVRWQDVRDSVHWQNVFQHLTSLPKGSTTNIVSRYHCFTTPILPLGLVLQKSTKLSLYYNPKLVNRSEL